MNYEWLWKRLYVIVKKNANSTKKQLLQSRLMSLWNGECWSSTVIIDFLMDALAYFCEWDFIVHLLMSLYSYCQRIQRPDFWGGESELLVSDPFDAFFYAYIFMVPLVSLVIVFATVQRSAHVLTELICILSWHGSVECVVLVSIAMEIDLFS